jgi:hypothetical protein
MASTSRETVALLIASPQIVVYSSLTLLCAKGVSCDNARAVFPLKQRLGFRHGVMKTCVASQFA